LSYYLQDAISIRETPGRTSAEKGGHNLQPSQLYSAARGDVGSKTTYATALSRLKKTRPCSHFEKKSLGQINPWFLLIEVKTNYSKA